MQKMEFPLNKVTQCDTNQYQTVETHRLNNHASFNWTDHEAVIMQDDGNMTGIGVNCVAVLQVREFLYV